jgi:hypothetical protein
LEQILYEPKLHLPISPTNNTKWTPYTS